MGRRISLLLVIVILLTSLPLLSVTAQETEMNTDMGVALNPSVSGEVEFWHFWASPIRHNAIRRIAAMCQEVLPNIIVTDVVKPFGDIWIANMAAVATGSGIPDVIVEDRPKLPQAAANGIEQNLQPFIDRDQLDTTRFWPFTWNQTLYEGDSYGIPFETDVRVLFYNRTLFEQAGLDPDKPPTTWAELEEYADRLDVIGEDGKLERMAFLPLQGNVNAELWAQASGHTWVQDGKPVLNDPTVVDTLNWIKTWVDRYGGWQAVQDFRSTFGAETDDAFMSGKVAMIVDVAGYNSFLNFYRPSIVLADGSSVRMDWGVAPIPNNGTPTSISGGFALSIPTGSDNPEAAWEFIKCATSPEAQVSWGRDTYAIPTDMAAANDPVLMADPSWKFFIEAMNTSTSGSFVAGYPNWNEQLGQRYEAIWTGDVSPEQVLAEAQQAVDDTLATNAP